MVDVPLSLRLLLQWYAAAAHRVGWPQMNILFHCYPNEELVVKSGS